MNIYTQYHIRHLLDIQKSYLKLLALGLTEQQAKDMVSICQRYTMRNLCTTLDALLSVEYELAKGYTYVNVRKRYCER